MGKSYTMYHCHTFFSLLDSATSYKDYVELAVRDGMKALSISEHGKPLNWCEKYGACKGAGIKYIHSVEAYLTETLDEKVRDNFHTVLMAKNMDGLKELNEIISRSCDKDHMYYVNRISFDEFLSLSDNIIATSACLASPLNKLDESHPRFMELARKYDFFEVQAHNDPLQIEFNKRLLRLSKELGKPLIAGTDTHSSSPYKAECRKILLEAKGKSYGDEDAFDLSYKTYDELVEMFKRQGVLSDSEIIEAIENTNELIGMTDDIELDTSIKYPILYGTREADSKMFRQTVDDMFADKLKTGVIPKEQEMGFRSSIEEEMRVFDKLKMNGFMLAQSEIVRWCKDQGFAIGPGRGSVGGSRVAYVTDIIDVNPETWHTIFSRFCNEYREEIGDIDIDVVEEDRPKIFQHIIDKFGADKTARVAAYGTIKEKGVADEVGRALAYRWERDHGNPNPKKTSKENPWSLAKIAEIKKQYDSDAETAKKKYPEIYYYMDGLLDVVVSQSVHPAGMVISPITLQDNYGVFEKDGESCLMLDMENVHDFTGLAKYDFLVLTTVTRLNKTCEYAGLKYPKMNEVDWLDEAVWDDMITNNACIFQFESKFAFDCLKKMKPKNIFDMSLVTACIRPTGSSYRDNLLARKIHKNPSEVIDELLKNNLGYLVYQEDTIAFLQQICGLSGGAADNIRRAIGRKQRDRLDAAMPQILEGYCSKSDRPREVAEQEAKEFLQVIEDSASYQFGYNHSIAYCLLGYLCAYYRYYYPFEFITAFLNNAANDEDIANGTAYATRRGIRITMPKWGASKSGYYFDKDDGVIAKGLSSVKFIGDGLAEEMYDLAQSREFPRFVDVLDGLMASTSINSKQLDILIKLDFFDTFGNQRELLRIADMYSNLFKQGNAKKINKTVVDGTPLEPIIKKYAVGTTKSGGEAKSYTMLDIKSAMDEAEDAIKAIGLSDLDIVLKAKNFNDIMGYQGLTTMREEDRPKLYVMNVLPLKRKKDGVQFGYSVITRSLGSGKETRFTVMNRDCKDNPIEKGDVIKCLKWTREGQYFRMVSFEKLYAGVS